MARTSTYESTTITRSTVPKTKEPLEVIGHRERERERAIKSIKLDAPLARKLETQVELHKVQIEIHLHREYMQNQL